LFPSETWTLPQFSNLEITDRYVCSSRFLIYLIFFQIEEEQERLRDAQAEFEECRRKVKVLLEHRDMVSQQLDHAVVGYTRIATFLVKISLVCCR